jgi:ribose transport system ATP-binding protein
MEEAAAAALAAVACRVSPRARIGALSVSQRQQVQLARAVGTAPGLLLLDEPTAVLGQSETAALFVQVRRLAAQGVGVVYVSHRLEEVLEIADRVTVMRDGAVVSTDAVGDVDVPTLVLRMVGRAPRGRAGMPVPASSMAAPRADREEVLRGVEIAAAHVAGASFTVHAGEIVGVAGLVGAGRSELLEAIAGRRPLRAGSVACRAVPRLIPEDRGRKGLVATLCARENLCLPVDGWVVDVFATVVTSDDQIIGTSGCAAAAASMPSFMSSDVAKIICAPSATMSSTTDSIVVSGRSAVFTLSSTIMASAGSPSCSTTYRPAS